MLVLDGRSLKVILKRKGLYTESWASLVAQMIKESICSLAALGLIPRVGRSTGAGHGNPLQYSCLENVHGQKSLAGYTVHGVAKSRTQLKRLSSRLYRLYSLFWSLLVAVDGQETGE